MGYGALTFPHSYDGDELGKPFGQGQGLPVQWQSLTNMVYIGSCFRKGVLLAPGALRTKIAINCSFFQLEAQNLAW